MFFLEVDFLQLTQLMCFPEQRCWFYECW